jgi:hypothetical protein
MKDDFKLPITVDVDITDEQAIEEAARCLGTTPTEIKQTIDFSHEVFAVAEQRDLTKGQLVTALMSVISMLVRETGDEKEQQNMCLRLFEGMWVSVGLEGPPLMLTRPSNEQVH